MNYNIQELIFDYLKFDFEDQIRLVDSNIIHSDFKVIAYKNKLDYIDEECLIVKYSVYNNMKFKGYKRWPVCCGSIINQCYDCDKCSKCIACDKCIRFKSKMIYVQCKECSEDFRLCPIELNYRINEQCRDGTNTNICSNCR
jgi:hypothetical protein